MMAPEDRAMTVKHKTATQSQRSEESVIGRFIPRLYHVSTKMGNN